MKTASLYFLLSLAPLALSAGIDFTEDDSRLAYETAAALVKECTPRNAGTLRGRLAANWLLDRASRTGADVEIDLFKDDTPDGEKNFANVIVELKGTKTAAPWIVIMSHYDTAPGIDRSYQGANDGASTSGLLVALTGAIRRAGAPADNIALVWTDGEECRKTYSANDGFHGSRHLVKSFREQNRAVKAAICLDMLGDRNLNIGLPENVTPALRSLVYESEKTCELSGVVSDMLGVKVKDDHSAFFDAGCPAVVLIDFEYGSAAGKNDYWHTVNDTIDKLSAESLLKSGRMVAVMLNRLME